MRWWLAAPLLLAAGCSTSLLSPAGDPAKLFRLSAAPTVSVSAPAVSWQLMIDEPDATQELNTARIAVDPVPTRVDYYAGVAWTDRAPVMLQNLMLESFDRSGKISAVQRQAGNIHADFLLISDLRRFEADATGTPTVRVEIAARLVRTRDRSIVATRSFRAEAPAGDDFNTTINGFDQAVQSVLPQLVEWTLTAGNANP